MGIENTEVLPLLRTRSCATIDLPNILAFSYAITRAVLVVFVAYLSHLERGNCDAWNFGELAKPGNLMACRGTAPNDFSS